MSTGFINNLLGEAVRRCRQLDHADYAKLSHDEIRLLGELNGLRISLGYALTIRVDAVDHRVTEFWKERYPGDWTFRATVARAARQAEYKLRESLAQMLADSPHEHALAFAESIKGMIAFTTVYQTLKRPHKVKWETLHIVVKALGGNVDTHRKLWLQAHRTQEKNP